MERTHYHLYHHQPDPLPPEEGADQAWLYNNATCYSLVARIAASTPDEALLAAQHRATGRPVSRLAQIQVGNLLRETKPGDVLVADYAAWMVTPTGELRRVTYAFSTPWKTLRQFAGQQANVDSLAWSPDGQVLAATASDRRVVLHVLTNDESYHTHYEGESWSSEALAWSPHGDRLAVAYRNGAVHLFRPAPGHPDGCIGSILICRTEERDASYSQPTPCSLTWSHDGVKVFAARKNGSVVGWDGRTGAWLFTRSLHEEAISTLAFSPRSEDRLLTASADGTVRLWCWDVSAKPPVCCEHGNAVTTACWSPDGSLIASCARTEPVLFLWHARTGELLARIALSICSSELLEVLTLSWSPDGRYLAAGCDDSTIQLIEVSRRQHRFTYRVDSRARVSVKVVAWSPDGESLAASDGTFGCAVWRVGRDLQALEAGL